MKNLLQKLTIVLLINGTCISLLWSSDFCQIQRIQSITQMLYALEQAESKKTLIAFDIDQTLINPDAHVSTLIDKESPEIICGLREHNIPVIGLTARSSYSCGPNQPKNKLLTSQLLQSVGIEFWHPQSCDTFLEDDLPLFGAVEFFNNIIFCNNRLKGHAFRLWLEHFYPDRAQYPQDVYFVEDMHGNIMDVYQACKRAKIPRFFGFHMVGPDWSSDED